MTTAFLLLSHLFACQSVTDAAWASVSIPSEAPAEEAAEVTEEQGYGGHEGVAPATESLRELRARLEALPPRHLTRAQAAGLMIVTNCPYNRGAAQVPMVMQRVLAQHDDAPLAALKAGVNEHVAVLELLGVTALPMPEMGDYLYMASPGVISAAELAASPDPVGLTATLLEDIPGLVQGYDRATREKIKQSGDLLTVATDNTWPMKGELMGFGRELDRLMAEETLSAAAFADLEALSSLLDEYAGHGC